MRTRVRPTAPGLLVGAGAEVATGARVGPRAVVSAGCRVAAGAEVRESVLLDGCAVGAGARVSGSVLAPGRYGRGRGGPCRRGRRPRMRESRLAGTMIDDVLGIPDQLRDALWRIESARLEPGDAAGVMVCGMGGSAIGGDLAAAALGDRLTRPLVCGPRLRAAELGDARSGRCSAPATRARPRRRWPASTPPRRSAPAASSPAPAAPLVDGAREAGVPVVGLPGIFQPRAAVAYMFTVAAEVAALAGAAPRDPHRDRRRRRLPRAGRPRPCRPAPPRSPPELGRRPAGRLRGRPDRPGRAALEDPGERERQAPRLLLPASRGRPQRALRLGRCRRRAPVSPRSSSRTATSTRACAAASS